jgi:hypothetical protein
VHYFKATSMQYVLLFDLPLITERQILTHKDFRLKSWSKNVIVCRTLDLLTGTIGLRAETRRTESSRGDVPHSLLGSTKKRTRKRKRKEKRRRRLNRLRRASGQTI